MWCRKIFRLAFVTGFSLPLLAEPAGSVESAAVKPSATVALHATAQEGEIIGNEQQRRVIMTIGGRRLMLAVPQGFRADISNPEKVVLVNQDYSCVLNCRLALPGSGAVTLVDAGLGRAWLSARLNDLQIREEFSTTSSIGNGPAFDLVCKVDGLVRTSRVAFITSPVGVFEFNCLSSPEHFEESKTVFRYLLRGIQVSNANGKLEVPPASSDS